ncbi:hypothetical protein CF510_18638 [Pseudomonas aeruginosa PADK2_CF510]|nr:hypothetical protein CF510_18638 [Pseudomonas aeruginosa PADK2_CF510]
MRTPAWLGSGMPLLFVLLWSTGFLGAKFGLPYAEPFTFLAIRLLLAAALLGALRPAQRCALAGLGTAGRACRGRRPAGPWPVPGRGVPRHRARHVGRPDLPVGRPATAGYRGPGRHLARRAGQPPAMAGTGARPGWRSPGGTRPHPRWRRRPGLGRGAGGTGGDHLRHAVPEALLRRHGPAHRRRRPVPGQRRPARPRRPAFRKPRGAVEHAVRADPRLAGAGTLVRRRRPALHADPAWRRVEGGEPVLPGAASDRAGLLAAVRRAPGAGGDRRHAAGDARRRAGQLAGPARLRPQWL